MTLPDCPALTRRAALAGAGALVVSFSLARSAFAQDQVQPPQNIGREPKSPAPLPGSLKVDPNLDAWIRIGSDDSITLFTGKAELGQGIKTALLQIAAEQLDVDMGRITLVTADTARTVNEGFTAGSHSMQDSGTAILHASAQVREMLLQLASARFAVAAQDLKAQDGKVVAPDGQSVRYGELVVGSELHIPATPNSRLKPLDQRRIMGKPVRRVDIPNKVAGGPAYVQDLRLPGMVHGRVVRPPSPGAKLEAVDAGAVERMPGVLKVARDGDWLAVIAEKEWQAVTAMRALAAATRWSQPTALPEKTRIFETLAGLKADTTTINQKQAPPAAAVHTIEAEYRRNYQLHGSIGPSCAVAQMQDGALTLWTHAQGMFPLRKAVAEMLSLPEDKVRCIHVEGSGCYGHNGADDAAADAALLARAMPGRPVRIQYMREDEHRFEPYGPVMTSRGAVALDGSGRIVDWRYEVRSNTHSTRPPGAGQLLSAQMLEKAFQPGPPQPLPQPEGGGDRNAIPLYDFPSQSIVHHFVPEMPLRVSAMRGLGAYHNVFAIESLMDEAAAAAREDPVAFRLKHLKDARGRDVVQKAAEAFGWSANATRESGRGRGFAFARYKNLGAYAAVAMEVSVDRETGGVRLLRAVAAVDSGEAVNPDGIRNQIEGGIIQSASWSLYEEVQYEPRRILSRDWSTYPILRFPALPRRVEVHIIDRPGQPFLGTGEATQGPAAAAIGNAIADAVGVRCRELPMTAARIKGLIGG
ncbi:aldehyde dehydrogenase [Alsobacter soli]|uniref:Aldehyde dehydrogenase n=1 Tax=Alsobacter soli TaxID=2109933 RepID=A0A2T1HM93_9HYPH|nr:molybdopterin cofactor-binding domain-containing protein [Alsobacter soli]PSC02756.1 aldehyde dehydrogenase [Alsobacter soli]